LLLVWRRTRTRRRRHVWRSARMRIGAARVVRLANPLQEYSVKAAARDVAPVIRAHLAGHHAWRLDPHRGPWVRRVVLLQEGLSHRLAHVLAEQDRGRALPTRWWKVRGEIREAGLAGRPVVDVHQRGGD